MAGARSGQMWDCLIEKNKPGNHGRPQGGGAKRAFASPGNWD